MTREEHLNEHFKLHRALDRLIADFLQHNPGRCLRTSIMELLEWSYVQVNNPIEVEQNGNNNLQ